MAFDPDWLRAALASAAGKAGYQGWWLVDDLVAGIAGYFRHDFASGVVDLVNFDKAVRSVLCDVGYEEVAMRFATVMPCHHVSLVQCLRGLPRNDRAKFFEQLATLIAGLDEARSEHFHFSDLHACVRGLKSIHPGTWHGDDDDLLERVIAFVRERMLSLGWKREVRCFIS